MEPKLIRHGNHGGYAYSYRTTDGYNFDSHIHRCYEFLYIMEGNFFYTVEGKEYVLFSGDMIVTNPDELHSFSFPENCIYKRQFLHIYPTFMEQFPTLLNTLRLRKPGTLNQIPAVLVDQYHLPELFSGLEEYCEIPSANTDIMVLSYAIQLIVKISTIIENENLATELNLNKNTVKIQKYINKNFKQNINLDELAKYLFLDKAYICRLFKQETGMTIGKYINLQRIICAKNMILDGKKASSLYTECGFNDYSTFYRSFIKYVGMTPENFKKVHFFNN